MSTDLEPEDLEVPSRFKPVGQLLRDLAMTHLMDAVTWPERPIYDERTGVTIFRCPDCRAMTARQSDEERENTYSCLACGVEKTRRHLEWCVRVSVPALRRVTRFDPDLIDVLLDAENGELL